MRTQDELQRWLDENSILTEELIAVTKWFGSQHFPYHAIYTSNEGKTLIDVIEFMDTPSPSKEKDLSPIVAQFAKVKKEVDKLQKLIAKL